MLMNATQNERSCRGWVRLGGCSGSQVEGFAGAEGHPGGVGPLGLFVAEVGVYLVEAGLPVARFKRLPWLFGSVEEGLGDAVEFGAPVPVASVGGQARQAKAGHSDVNTMSA